ncbi:dTDP-glucose 4,6-dehydratase [Marinibaculum pumilum]|uniref:dTDP-glucose 4,6-dehydratase n=1 Tax=Marinibaculum pumilum TaxID=1766165 RepID=A0ABV7KVG1_9PROT
MTVLVTGGAGFIGSALVRALLADGERVVNLDRLTYAGSRLNLGDADAAPGHVFVEGDVADATLLRRLFAEYRPRTVYHLAAETHVDRSIDGPLAFIRTNVDGTAVLLAEALHHWRALPEAEAGAFRLVAVSTDEVFGSLQPGGFFRPDSPYRPNSPYAASKAAADHLARAWHVTYGLPVIVTNCGNNYGPCQFPEKLIPLTVLNALEGRDLPVYGDGRQERDWIHVDDHVAGLRRAAAAGQPGAVYLLGAANVRSNLEIVHGICAALDRLRPDAAHAPHAGLIRHVADRPGHDRRYALDVTATAAALDWRAEIAFEDGLAATVAWYLENPDWVAAMSARYDRGRLGRKA